jgi:carbamoyltransferase
LSCSDQVLNGLDKLNLQRSLIPAVTHVDNSSRIQTVSKVTNNKFWDLLNKFYEYTNCPVLVNTSFNIRGEPIVCTPEDSFKCFMGTELDVLVVGNAFLEKSKQLQSLSIDSRRHMISIESKIINSPLILFVLLTFLSIAYFLISGY